MTKPRIVTLGLVACAALAISSILAVAVPTADEILAQMRANATAIEDLDAHLTVQTYAEGSVKLTQELRLLLLQPDKMRQEFLSPDYLAGNLTLIGGDAMRIYIAASETWYSQDLLRLSDAEQPWLAFRQLLRSAQDELEKYAFELLEASDGAYHLRGSSALPDAVYGAIELWVDAATFVPQRRLLYDADGKLLVDARILDVEEISPGIFMARRLETFNEAGQLRNVIRYDSVVVNQGLDALLFAAPEAASQ